MRSPRFDVRAKKLRTIFSPSNIERIWTDKVRKSMKEQFLHDGIEYLDFHIARKLESTKLSRIILSGDYVPQKAQRILVEKSKGLCRQLVIPSVRDAIVLQCLSDALYSEVKGKSPTNKSFFEPKDHSFALPSPTGYGTFASWINFQKALFNFSKVRRFVVVTDIANYYDSISYVHLRNAISSISDVEECVLDMLIYVLSDLLWQPDYTPRVEVGLPQINLDAPRLLAHCFLYEVDAFLDADPAAGDFVRFMDDIDIGVDSIVNAKYILKSLDLVLQTKQIRINSGKTLILTSDEAIRHFRIIENSQIDKLKKILDTRKKNGKSIDRARRLISLRISRGIRRKSFDDGNGDKILKRWIGLAAQTGADISPETLEYLIKMRPSVRDSIYSFVRSRPLTPSIASALARAACSGLLVDDCAMVEMANHLVETLNKRKHCHSQIVEIISCSSKSTYFGIYSALWMLSKFGGTDEILRTLIDNRDVWIPHERLGRLAGSFLPVFINTSDEIRFKDLLAGTLNSGVRESYKFHTNLMNNKTAFDEIFHTLKAANPSRGTHITHAKFLCLLSALQNKAADPKQIEVLRINHRIAFSDTYYRGIARNVGLL